jgi:hypothetical protein
MPQIACAATPAPVIVKDISELYPFSQRLDITFSLGSVGSGTIAVPAGQRLVIDYISANAGLPVGATILFDVSTISGGVEIESHLPMIPQGTILGEATFAMSSPVKIYADANSTVTISVIAGGAAGKGGLIVGVYGHLIPVP